MSGLTASNGTITIISPEFNGPLVGDADFEWDLGGDEVTVMRSNVGTNGFIEKPSAGMITFNTWYNSDVDPIALNRIRNAIIQVDINIGHLWSMSNSSRVGPPLKLTTSDGKFSLAFSGDPWRRIA